MHHVAIMKKSWGLLPRILSGEKTIESRWYMNRAAPWGKIKKGDTVFFKNSGEPVTVCAQVAEVMEFSALTPKSVNKILTQYGKRDGINKDEYETYYSLFKGKHYCVLIFLEKACVIDPFEINKKGFGAMAAWITVSEISDLKTV